MDSFLLVTETALYRRRYVIKKPPGTEVNKDLSTLVALGVELPEGYTLETPLKDIVYKTEEISIENSDIVLKQAMQKLTSLEDWEVPLQKTKPKRKTPEQAERGNITHSAEDVSVKPKVKRSKSINWEALASQKEEV